MPKNRSRMRATLVSSTATDRPNAWEQIARAVYLPIPGSLSNSVSESGIFPAYSSTIILAESNSRWARKKSPKGCRSFPISSTVAVVNLSRVG